jgi:hypothetical protein
MVQAGVGIDAEQITGFHAVEFQATPIVGTDLHPGRMAAALGIGRTGWIARTAAIAPHTMIVTFTHIPGAAALAGPHVKLHPAAAALPFATFLPFLVLVSTLALRWRFKPLQAGQGGQRARDRADSVAAGAPLAQEAR